MNIEYTAAAVQDLENLPPVVARRIVGKMFWFAKQENPLSFAKKLTDTKLGTHRFRVGDYRVLVDVKGGKIRILLVLTVQHRKDVYRL